MITVVVNIVLLSCLYICTLLCSSCAGLFVTTEQNLFVSQMPFKATGPWFIFSPGKRAVTGVCVCFMVFLVCCCISAFIVLGFFSAKPLVNLFKLLCCAVYCDCSTVC